MATVSIASPSCSRKRNFSVPSVDTCRAATASRGRSNSSANALRSGAGSSVIASKLGTGLCQSRRSTCSVRYAGWPTRSKYSDNFFRASEMDRFEQIHARCRRSHFTARVRMN